jgi:cell division protein FtsB
MANPANRHGGLEPPSRFLLSLTRGFFMYKILAAIVLALAFTACTNAEAEAEIARLKQENVTLQSEIKNLQQTLDSVMAKSDSIYKNLSDMDMQ